jgi:hypothetical protein
MGTSVRGLSYLVEGELLCEPCAREHFGWCRAHSGARLDCCARWPLRPLEADRHTLMWTRQPDGSYRCTRCRIPAPLRALVRGYVLPAQQPMTAPVRAHVQAGRPRALAT